MRGILLRAFSLIDKPQNVDDVRHFNGNTEDIIKVISEADGEAATGRKIKRFAPLLRGATQKATCQNIWNFVKQNIGYKADRVGYERIKLPNKTIYDALKHGYGGDCKSFSVLIADLLREHGIKCFYRFISQKAGKKFHHVYIVAVLDDGHYVYMDAVYHSFNSEPSKVLKQDVPSVALRQNTEGVSGFINGVIF